MVIVGDRGFGAVPRRLLFQDIMMSDLQYEDDGGWVVA